jgi:hypothetical protein
MKNEILDAMNEASKQGKAVQSIRVTSGDLWSRLHHDDYLRKFLTATPGGMAAFCGVPIYFEASDSAEEFHLKF